MTIKTTDVASPNAKPIRDHEPGECLFPVDDVPEGATTHDVRFCCNPVEKPGARYCHDHAVIAYGRRN